MAAMRVAAAAVLAVLMAAMALAAPGDRARPLSDWHAKHAPTLPEEYIEPGPAKDSLKHLVMPETEPEDHLVKHPVHELEARAKAAKQERADFDPKQFPKKHLEAQAYSYDHSKRLRDLLGAHESASDILLMPFDYEAGLLDRHVPHPSVVKRQEPYIMQLAVLNGLRKKERREARTIFAEYLQAIEKAFDVQELYRLSTPETRVSARQRLEKAQDAAMAKLDTLKRAVGRELNVKDDHTFYHTFALQRLHDLMEHERVDDGRRQVISDNLQRYDELLLRFHNDRSRNSAPHTVESLRIAKELRRSEAGRIRGFVARLYDLNSEIHSLSKRAKNDIASMAESAEPEESPEE